MKARCIRLRRGSLLALGLVAAAVALTALSSMRLTAQTLSTKIPVYQVDPSWPKPLPNGWGIGPVSGISADSRDHVWIVHRPRAVAEPKRAQAAPPVLEYDVAGKFVKAWGGDGQGYDWPQQLHGISVWTEPRSSRGTAPTMRRFSHIHRRKVIRQIALGKMSGSNDTANLGTRRRRA